MNRRELFDPRRIVQTAGEILTVCDEPIELPRQSSHESPLLQFGRQAMATSFEIALPFGTPQATLAAQEGLDLVDRLEAQMTVYRDDSDVARINQYAALGPVPMETRLFDLFELAARNHRETEAAYDIAVGQLIKTWGFYRRQGRVPTDQERTEALSRSGMQHVVLDSERHTVHFRKPGIEVNLGSIGKGYALDRVAENLRSDWNIHCGLLHGGTSSVLAMSAPPQNQRGWPVGLGHRTSMRRRLGVVWLRDRALGTSSTTFQHLTHQGRKLGHILDPRTGWPAEQLASASAIAPTAAEADALATAFFVLGAEQTQLYCKEHPEVGAVLLPADHRNKPVVIGNVDFQ
jgi:thiamine biosynthesis lipoprotein